MRLDRILLFSIMLFVYSIMSNAIKNILFPELYDNETISLSIAFISLASSLVMWILPAIIALIRKEIQNRMFVICLSLLLPVVGCFFSYFLIRTSNKNER